jgi:hypothetical protein
MNVFSKLKLLRERPPKKSNYSLENLLFNSNGFSESNKMELKEQFHFSSNDLLGD